MKHIFFLFTVAVFIILCGCSASSYQKTKDGIIVKINKTDKTEKLNLRLKVINDNIIHVSATPERAFSKEKSLIVVPELGTSQEFNVNEDSACIVLSTNILDVKVNKTTGELDFKDKSGKSILRENKGGGKSFVPIEVEGTKGFSIQQFFESPADEAFYGLGQHQSDEFNYKGKNESLFSI